MRRTAVIPSSSHSAGVEQVRGDDGGRATRRARRQAETGPGVGDARRRKQIHQMGRRKYTGQISSYRFKTIDVVTYARNRGVIAASV